MVERLSHFQDALKILEKHHPKIVLALKSRKFTNLDLRDVFLLDNQLTFNSCCNKYCTSKIIKAGTALKKIRGHDTCEISITRVLFHSMMMNMVYHSLVPMLCSGKVRQEI
jgi:hypothetical protein